MASPRCPGCRHDVPAGRWCNRCGAPLVDPVPDRSGRRAPPGWLVAVLAVVLLVGVAGVTAGRVGEDVSDVGRGASGDVALPSEPGGVPGDGPRPIPSGPRTVSRPGEPIDVTPRTEVVCSDLQVRAVPSSQLPTTEVGVVVELAPGPCVVMGPEGAASP